MWTFLPKVYSFKSTQRRPLRRYFCSLVGNTTRKCLRESWAIRTFFACDFVKGDDFLRLNEVRKAQYKERFESLNQALFDDEDGRGLELPDESKPSADQLVWTQTMVQKIQEFLNELPEKQRIALLLNRLEALSYQEIAEILDISIGAVKSLLHRARHTLQQRLEYWKNEEAKKA